jgi:cytochrome b involved in lipid metabolism
MIIIDFAIYLIYNNTMKKTIILLSTLFLLISCTDNTVENKELDNLNEDKITEQIWEIEVTNIEEKIETITEEQIEAEVVEEIIIQNDTKEENKISLSLQEISQHNSSWDCYTAIDWKVYNVTSFFGIHPGWDENLLKTCWIDATELFNNQHWEDEKAKIKKEEFYIWELSL